MNLRTALVSTFALCTLFAAKPADAAGPRAVAKSSKTTAVAVARPVAVNKLFVSRKAALELWEHLKSTKARIEGKITVDPDVQSSLLGSCSDIVVNAYDGYATSENKIASVKGFGNLSSGQCSYVMYISPNAQTRMYSWYDGPSNSSHPGDYLQITNQTAQPFAASAGGKKTFDFLLTYDWIK